MNRRLLILSFIVLIIIVAGFIWERKGYREANKTSAGKVKVAASFYPIYFFAKEIGKDRVGVINLTPAGAEPHDFEPSTRDLANLEQSDILLINGSNFEPWVDRVRQELEKNEVKIVKLSEGGQLLNRKADPHVWLDPQLAKQEVFKIQTELSNVDSKNAETYKINASQLVEKLDRLDRKFNEGLSSCTQRSFVTSHAAFGHLSSRYGLNQVPISGISPDQEPSPSELAEVTKFAKENGVKYIFFETLVSPRLADTIAKEIGAKTLVLDPIEGVPEIDQQAGKDYFSIQEENLRNLRIALECR